MRYSIHRCLPLLLALFLLPGCSQAGALSVAASQGDLSQESVSQSSVSVDAADGAVTSLDDESVALADAPALPTYLMPVASGTLEKRNSKAVIDYSNTKDGYVMVQYIASTTKRLKAQVKGPTTTYTYNLTSGQWTTFSLSDGNGSYQIVIYENIEGTKYSSILSQSFSAAMTDEFAPFLRPNQYVDYAVASNTVAKAAELTRGVTAPLDKVAVVYKYVISNLTYDKQLAATVQSGYLPVLDTVLAKKTGICFDYAALMTGMLRSQDVPCKLIVGYAGSVYHAWISVWSEETGWIDGAIYFDGTSWQRMDPTFASSGKQSQAIMAYIGDGKNYSAKYFY
ncbi:MAG: transglutaminase-like domain-containing protein [Lawsonibacter sp.]|nr:transglutaminase-like domain-containing protein [Lawsonibacter sp.]